MRFEWDEDKNRRNLAKHKVSFDTASLVFDDPGCSAFRIALLKERSEISARKAIARERRAYAKSQKRSSG